MLPASEQDISPPTVMMAATLVRMAHPTNENLHNALSKAESRLFTHAWTVDGGVLQIESESNVGNFRHTDGDSCDCPTRKYICWHRGAHFILSVLAAAMIAPIRSHFEPLATRTAAAAEDPASLGNFLDRPEIAGEIEDVAFGEPELLPYQTPEGRAQLEAQIDRIVDEMIAEQTPIEVETAAERAAGAAYDNAHPGASPREARMLAYAAARAAGAGYSEANNAADRAAIVALDRKIAQQRAPELAANPGVPLGVYAGHVSGKPGRRAALDDSDLIKRRKLGMTPSSAPVVWDTAQFADQEEDSEDKNGQKIVASHKRAESPPDPFEDVL